MAIYHMSIKIGSKGKGQSAVAAAAYRSGEKLTDKETGLTSDYTQKGGVVFSEISLCENAPAEYADRATLWNAVHQIEKNKNAQLWREFEVALPRELSREQQIETVRDFVKQLTAKGMCVDWSLHDKGDGNPHAHIMTTMRSITEDGKWAPKSRLVYDLDEHGERIFQKVNKQGRKQYKNHKEDFNDWNAAERIEEWRAAWAKCCNARITKYDHIDHRSYERQGIDFKPTIHEGYVARKIEREGGVSERCQDNRETREYNEILKQMIEQMKQIILLQQQLQQDIINIQNDIRAREKKNTAKENKLRLDSERLKLLDFSEKRKIKKEIEEIEKLQSNLKENLDKLQVTKNKSNKIFVEIKQIYATMHCSKPVDDLIRNTLESRQRAVQTSQSEDKHNHRRNMLERFDKASKELEQQEQRLNHHQQKKKNDLEL